MTAETFGYARVSTADQILDRQLDALRGAGVPEANIHTEKISGAKAARERPVLAALLGKLRTGDTLVADELSRLGRRMTDVVMLVHRLTEDGVRVRTLREGIDTADERMGPLLVALFAWMAQMQRQFMLEQQAAARQARIERGGPLGRPHAIPDASTRAAIVAAYEGGTSWRVLMRSFGIGRSTVFRYITEAREARESALTPLDS